MLGHGCVCVGFTRIGSKHDEDWRGGVLRTRAMDRRSDWHASKTALVFVNVCILSSYPTDKSEKGRGGGL